MAAQIKVHKVQRNNDFAQSVTSVTMIIKTLDDPPVTRYMVVFVPDVQERKPRAIGKYFYDERGNLINKNARVPDEIFSRMAKTAAAIMFKRKGV